MKRTRHDMPLDAFARPLPGGWPARTGNYRANHSAATTTETGYRYASIHHANLVHQPADAGACHRPRLATWDRSHGPTDVLAMTDHWRPYA